MEEIERKLFSKRKQNHIDLASSSQFENKPRINLMDYFDYEPLMTNNVVEAGDLSQTFLNKTISYPFLISSMTASGEDSTEINKVLAQTAKHYNLPFALGSCRKFLFNNEADESMLVRDELGDGPLLANLGIAQVEELVESKELSRINKMMQVLNADALYIHINPMQEIHQEEGDRYWSSPIELISKLVEEVDYPVLVKEVGQGMGPRSLETLLNLNIYGIDSASLGGTNFTYLEKLRGKNKRFNGFIEKRDWNGASSIGHSIPEMINFLKNINNSDKVIILSGGVRSPEDAFLYKQLLGEENSLIGMAYPFLQAAQNGLPAVQEFFESFLYEYLIFNKFLHLKDKYNK
ncbi:hypothetical protein N9N67_04395 [Bacteriovoracaceae bacterium]|nr:hypothetical protein [Bacteriovoracaceae bacterium]